MKPTVTKQAEPTAVDLAERLGRAREEAIAALERARQRAGERTDGAIARARAALGIDERADAEVGKLEAKVAEIDGALAELRDECRREAERAADRAWQRALPAIVAARRAVEVAARRLLDAVEEADAALMQARRGGATCAPVWVTVFGSNRAALQTMLDAFASETDSLAAAAASDGTLRVRLLSDCDGVGKRGEVVKVPARTAVALLRSGAAEAVDLAELEAWRARGQG